MLQNGSKILIFIFLFQTTFELECEDYENYLNDKYKLCSTCMLAFKREIDEQDNQIKEMYGDELKKRRKVEGLRKLKGKVCN